MALKCVGVVARLSIDFVVGQETLYEALLVEVHH